MPTRSYRHTVFDGTCRSGPYFFSSNCSCPPVSVHLSLRRGQVSRIKHMRYIYLYIHIYKQYAKASPRARCDVVRDREQGTKNNNKETIQERNLWKRKPKNEREPEILCHSVPLSTCTTTSTYPATIIHLLSCLPSTPPPTYPFYIYLCLYL